MQRFLLFLALAGLAATVSAQGPAQPTGVQPDASQHQGRVFAPVFPQRMTYAQRKQWANRYYPKYTFGLHERQFENIGVPTGDIGLRGNGITRTPW